MLAMMIACPMVRAPLPIEVPKLHNMPVLMLQVLEGKVYNSEDTGTALMHTVLPVGHIIGADAEGKSIGEHCGASKDYGQLCGHLHHHHELFRYVLYNARASIVNQAGPSI